AIRFLDRAGAALGRGVLALRRGRRATRPRPPLVRLGLAFAAGRLGGRPGPRGPTRPPRPAPPSGRRGPGLRRPRPRRPRPPPPGLGGRRLGRRRLGRRGGAPPRGRLGRLG